jgi:peptidoglycan/LPS O-acetylase OafA/YrhL
MRGIAAISVVLFHADRLSPIPLPSAYLAVDLFFAISGFILAEIYEPRLRDGMTPTAFMQVRLMRLYPLYFAGTLFGLLVLAASAIRKGESFAATIPFSLLFLPTPGTAREFLFPANHPAWSLFYEMLVNLAFSTVLWRLRTIRLIIIVLVSGGLLLNFASTSHVNAGATVGDLWIGLARATYGFTAGMLVQRLNSARHLQLRRPQSRMGWIAILLPLALFPLTLGPVVAALAMLVMPVFVILGLAIEVSDKWLPEKLGAISYGLYSVHAPILIVAWFVAMQTQFPITIMSIGIATSLALAAILERSFDVPARQFLATVLKSRTRN